MCLDNAKPEDFQKPGHVFPLRSHPDGLKARKGHTEASIELMKLANLKEVAVISELLNDDGTTMSGKDLHNFSKKHNLKITSVEEICKYIQ
jgi:3,4-dihydroxy-2-butanone 4-phosphate synthase